MPAPSKYPDELGDRAVRLVFDMSAANNATLLESPPHRTTDLLRTSHSIPRLRVLPLQPVQPRPVIPARANVFFRVLSYRG